MMMIRVRDLTDQMGMEGPRPFLMCSNCKTSISANAADYVFSGPDHVFVCCGEPMILVVEQVIYKEVCNDQ